MICFYDNGNQFNIFEALTVLILWKFFNMLFICIKHL